MKCFLRFDFLGPSSPRRRISSVGRHANLDVEFAAADRQIFARSLARSLAALSLLDRKSGGGG